MSEQQRAAPRQERVTLLDVARHARVSRATASLVLRGSPLVAEETRGRVLDSMRQLGYVYHRAAATLRTRRSHTVGLVVTDITNPFFAELTVGIEARLDEANHVLMLANTAESLAKQDRLLATIHENGADGVLICPAEGTPRGVIDELCRHHLPVVLLVRYLFDADVDYAGADNTLGAELAVEHLLAHDHHRIAFIGGHATSSAWRDRVRGYSNALRRHGIPVDEALLAASAPTRDGGIDAVRQLLELPDPPTAALCYNDVVAFGVMLGAQALGRTLGREFAVIGFDDVPEAALCHPPLTTVAIAPRRIGAAAAELLLQRITDPDAPARRAILPPTLVVRASCGPHHE